MSAASAEPYAAIGDRMLALILDRVVIVALFAVPIAWMRERGTAIDVRAALLIGASLLIATLVYHIVLEALFGATLGKGLLGLQVRTRSDNGRWLASAVRNVARIIDSILFYALAFLVAVFTARRQRIGDLLAGTTVNEQRVPWGARVALLFILVVLVAGSLWIAAWICPACVPDRSRLPF